MPDTTDPDLAAKIKEAAGLMGKLFIARKDRKAVFRPDFKGNWHWTALDESFKMGDFREHLTGQHSLGTYMLSEDSMVKFMAFDLDLSKSARFLLIHDVEKIEELEGSQYNWDLDLQPGGNLEAALHQPSDAAHRWARIILLEAMRQVKLAVAAQIDLPVLTVVSGGGGHVLVPLPEPAHASEVRSAGIEIAASLPSAVQRNEIFFDYGAHKELSIEVFPKQDTLQDKPYGNLIRLPYGWHYEAGVRTYSIDPDVANGAAWNWKKISSIKALRGLAQTAGVE